MSQSSLRGHSLKLNKKRVRSDVAKFSFSNRVVNEWNILDEEIISGCSLAGFRRKLDRHLRDKRGSFSFLPLFRQLDDLDPLMHQHAFLWKIFRERFKPTYAVRYMPHAVCQLSRSKAFYSDITQPSN